MSTNKYLDTLIYKFALALITFFGCYKYYWVGDDAFISFRYAKNFANGFGLTFNPFLTEKIEGYSNLLWVLVASLSELLKVPSYLTVPWLSIVITIFMVLKVFDVLQRQTKQTLTFSFLTTLSLALFPALWVWASSGLETIAFSALLLYLFDCLFLNHSLHLRKAILLSLLTILIRAEGFAWVIFLLTSYWLLNLKSKRSLVLLLTGLTFTVTLFAWRYSYYGTLLPNTASAKVGFSLERLARGFDYVFIYWLTFVSPLLIALFGLFTFIKKPNLKLFYILVFTSAFYAYAILVGGDFMSMGRFMAPTFALSTLILGLSLAEFKATPSHQIILIVLLIFVAVLPSFDLYLLPKEMRAKFHFRHNRSVFMDENAHWRFMRDNSLRWRAKGEFLNTISKPGQSLVEGAIGNVGYFSNLTIFDRVGLVTRLRPKKAEKSLRSPGHDVRVGPEYFLPEKPDFLFAKDMSLQALKAIIKNKKNYPDLYAVVVYKPAYSQGEKKDLFVTLQRFANQLTADNAWKEAELWERRL